MEQATGLICIRRNQCIAGTAAVVVLLTAYEYNVVAMIVGAYVLAMLLWWALRVRPGRALAKLVEATQPPTHTVPEASAATPPPING